jgi:hypothetical protein
MPRRVTLLIKLTTLRTWNFWHKNSAFQNRKPTQHMKYLSVSLTNFSPFQISPFQHAFWITKFFHTNSCTFTYNYVLVF